jgi:hypothetical protein
MNGNSCKNVKLFMEGKEKNAVGNLGKIEEKGLFLLLLKSWATQNFTKIKTSWNTND